MGYRSAVFPTHLAGAASPNGQIPNPDATTLRAHTARAAISLRIQRIPAFAQDDDLAACPAAGRLVGRRILQFFKVILVGPVPDVHFRLHHFPALGTRLPIPWVPLGKMCPAKRVTPVVAGATVGGVGKQFVLVLIVADPLPAALGSHQASPLAAQTAPRCRRPFSRALAQVCPPPRRRMRRISLPLLLVLFHCHAV